MLFKKGSRGKEVKQIQEKLKELGYFNAECTSYYGSVTSEAVSKYQEDNNLVSDGIVGEKTWNKLFDIEEKQIDEKEFNIDNITVEIIHRLMPLAPLKNIEMYLPGVIRALKNHKLDDKDMFLMAIGTISAETEIFKPLDEHISKYNTKPGGRPYSLYDFRTELGNFAIGDGDRYKGRGFIQLTGKFNYNNYGKLISKLWDKNIDLINNPELANDPEIAAEILVLFLKDRESRIRKAIKNNDFVSARKAVNGGTHGITEFRRVFTRARGIF